MFSKFYLWLSGSRPDNTAGLREAARDGAREATREGTLEGVRLGLEDTLDALSGLVELPEVRAIETRQPKPAATTKPRNGRKAVAK